MPASNKAPWRCCVHPHCASTMLQGRQLLRSRVSLSHRPCAIQLYRDTHSRTRTQRIHTARVCTRTCLLCVRVRVRVLSLRTRTRRSWDCTGDVGIGVVSVYVGWMCGCRRWSWRPINESQHPQATCLPSTFAPANGSGHQTRKMRLCPPPPRPLSPCAPSSVCGYFLAFHNGCRLCCRRMLLRHTRTDARAMRGDKDRWQKKGLDPKYYHTEPDGSNWVFSFASQSLLNAGLPAQAAYQPAPWDLDPNLECHGVLLHN